MPGDKTRYQRTLDKARQQDLQGLQWLSDAQGAALYSISINSFRSLSKRIGCRRQFGRKIVRSNRAAIDEALKRGETVEG